MELHCAQLLHGGDYNPEQWMEQKDTIWQEDMRYAKEAGINTLSVGIFAWSYLEPEDGVYDFSWMDEVMDNLARNGLKAVLATPSGARPPWMAQKYPSVLRVTENRLRRPYGDRQNACLSSPDFNRKVREINARLAERYKDHPALMLWHVSNEYENDCHCPLCQERFREWLKARYGDIENLNRQWWNSFWSHRFTSFDQIESPSPIGETASPALKLAWRRFCTDNLIRFFRMEVEPLRQFTPNVPVTANLMGVFPGLDYFALGKELDVSSWDNYPPWTGDQRDVAVSREAAFKHDLMRGVCDQKPFLMMESSPSAVNWHTINALRAPGTILYQGLHAVAHGSDSVQYFQFRAGRGGSEQHHGAVIDHTGANRTRVFREVAQVGRALQSLGAVAGSRARNEIALLYDWDARWALDDASLLHRGNQRYVDTALSFHTALGALGYGVDVVDQTRPLDGYRLLVAPMAYLLRNGFGERLRAFVRGGGTLVVTYVSGYVNEELLTYPDSDPSPLNELTGVHVDECDALDASTFAHFRWNGKDYRAHEMAELCTPVTAAVLAAYADRFYAGTPCFTVNEYGEGRCYYIAARTGADFLADALGMVAGQCGLAPLVRAMDDGVEVAARYGTDGERFLFLMNPSHEEKAVELHAAARDAATGEPCAARLTLPGMSVRAVTEA